MTLVDKLRTDPEIKKLKKEFHDLYGTWPPFSFEEHSSLEGYKKYMETKIKNKKEAT